MNLPTNLTVARIVMIPLFIVLFFVEAIPYNRFFATAVFMLASATDFLDGRLARKYNLVTNLGKFLDPIADKMLVSCALIAVSVETTFLQTAVVIFTMVILCRELMISAFRTIACTKNVILAADKLGKIKTTLQMIALILLIPYADIYALHGFTGDVIYYIGFAFLSLATLMTIVSALNYVIKNREVLKD